MFAMNSGLLGKLNLFFNLSRKLAICFQIRVSKTSSLRVLRKDYATVQHNNSTNV